MEICKAPTLQPFYIGLHFWCSCSQTPPQIKPKASEFLKWNHDAEATTIDFSRVVWWRMLQNPASYTFVQ